VTSSHLVPPGPGRGGEVPPTDLVPPGPTPRRGGPGRGRGTRSIRPRSFPPSPGRGQLGRSRDEDDRPDDPWPTRPLTPVTEWDWQSIQEAEQMARERFARYPRCAICDHPMVLDQPDCPEPRSRDGTAHYVCADAAPEPAQRQENYSNA
jgi:hypothetical protein